MESSAESGRVDFVEADIRGNRGKERIAYLGPATGRVVDAM